MKKVYSPQNWDQSRRYKVGEIVLFNGGEYQNITGKNSSPSLEVDFTKIGSTNIQTATSLISGSVKTDITETDPIVYVKDSIDDLLSDKADLVGGTIPLNQLSNDVVVKSPNGTVEIYNDSSAIVCGSDFGPGGIFYSSSNAAINCIGIGPLSRGAVIDVRNFTENIAIFRKWGEDKFVVKNDGGLMSKGLVDATNLVSYDRQLLSDIDGNFGYAPKVEALKKYENTTIPTFNIITNVTNLIVSVLQIPVGFILSNELYEYIGLVGYVNVTQSSLDIKIYTNSTNALDGNEILLGTKTISVGYGNDITLGGVELKTLGNVVFNYDYQKVLQTYIIIAVTTDGFTNPVDINVPYHGIRKLN